MKIRLYSVLLFAVHLLAVHGGITHLFTCDLDLVSDAGNEFYKPWTPAFLSDTCRASYIHKFTDPPLYQIFLKEAIAFKNFISAIERYEARKSGKELCANREYALYIEDRQKFYKQVDLCSCYKKNNYETFLNCLTEKRKQLANIINNARG